jgi:DtxR family Mn-dependent transcriptional regulator
MPSMSSENYLIAICTFIDEGQQPTLARLAAFCGVSLPTMSQAARRLERDGLVRLEPRRGVELTESGREIADTLLRRHRLIERWLTDVLQLDWATAHDEAHRLEHAVSPVVEQRMAASMGFPTTCPHGNPIVPLTPQERATELRALSTIPAGQVVRLRRISELAEDNHELMEFYESNGFSPGTMLSVRDRGPLHGPITVAVGGTDVPLSPEAAAYLWVWPPEAGAELGAAGG